MRILFLACCLALPLRAQLDTSALNNNTWVNLWSPTTSLSITGNNWAYENDLSSHPYYGFFVMGPGHLVHPQDCYFYPFDPVKKTWTKINSPRRSPRRCMGSFTVSSQDTMIIQLGGAEGSHQLGQGGWNPGYNTIDLGGKRGTQLWAYSFSRNHWYNMDGPVVLPGSVFNPLPQYDPVHDLVIQSQGSSTWLYHFQSNTSKEITGSPSAPSFSFSCAVDRKRGLYYLFTASAFQSFNPETEQWSTVPGTPPSNPTSGDGLNMLAYDEVNDAMVFVGDDNGALNTWVFYCDSLKWSRMTTTGGPQDRGRLAYNRALNAFMMLGGTASGNISRGGSTQGIWIYRYKRGPGVFAGRPAAPAVSVDVTTAVPALHWTPVIGGGVTGYNVYRGVANSFPKNFQKLNTSLVTANTYSDPSATGTSNYAYKVCAVNGSGESEPSRILYTRPARVLGVVASVEDSHTVRVSWEPNASGEAVGYNVYRARGTFIYAAPFPGGYVKVNSTTVTGLEFVDVVSAGVGFADNTARGYVVKAVNGLNVEGGISNECTTLPDSPEWSWTIPQSGQTAFRWQPPRRTKILGVNLYRIHEDQPVDSTKVKVLCGGADFYFPIRTYATLQNGTKLAPALITDTLSFWPLPPQIFIPPATDITGYYLQGQTFVARAVNVLGQEGFCTDQLSPVNNEYGFGLVPATQRFNYAAWSPVVATETRIAQPLNSLGIETWPNPFNSSLNVAFRARHAGSAEVRMIDAAGRVVVSKMVRALEGLNTGSFRMPKLSAGIYLVQVTSEGRVLRKSVVMMK